MIRRILFALVAVIVIAAGALWWATRPPPVLTVATWAGSYAQAQDRSMMRPFTAARGVDTRLALWDGNLDVIARAVRTKSYDADVYDLELPQAVKACAQGLLEKIDAERLPRSTGGVAAVRDFVPGAIGPCWVGSVVYSQVIAVRPHAFATPPTRLADFFDTARFPGRRVLLSVTPKFNLEMALLADGVAPDKVYVTLSTPQGVARALARLKTLDPLWVRTSQAAMNLLRNGQAVMAPVLNGDLFTASRQGFSPGVIWDHQLYELDVFAIPKGNPRAARALAFIHFATGTEPLAQVAGWLPYGPARRSSWPDVGPNPALKMSMAPFQPTAHFATAFAVDDGWWQDHLAALMPRWQAFVQGAG